MASILEKIGFKVEGGGDLVLARTASAKMDRIESHLYLIGRMIGFARQLDILMTDDAAVNVYFQRFIANCDIK